MCFFQLPGHEVDPWTILGVDEFQNLVMRHFVPDAKYELIINETSHYARNTLAVNIHDVEEVRVSRLPSHHDNWVSPHI